MADHKNFVISTVTIFAIVKEVLKQFNLQPPDMDEDEFDEKIAEVIIKRIASPDPEDKGEAK